MNPTQQPPGRRVRRALRITTALAVPATTLSVAMAFVALLAPAATAAQPAPTCSLGKGAFVCSVTYGYSGAEDTFTAPAGISHVDVTAVGASGGAYGSPRPGRGAVAAGGLDVTPGTAYFVEVGQTGGRYSFSEGAPAFNGGGGVYDSGSGGGATDLRTVSRSQDAATSLASRLIVAGGGGGADVLGSGGDAGLVGSDGTGSAPGRGATQTAGGAGGSGAQPGTLGSGGHGASSGGGGGGGLYGGGGAGSLQGAGGGSSLVTAGGAVSANTSGLPSELVVSWKVPVTAVTGLTPAATSTTAGSPVGYLIGVRDAAGDTGSDTPETLAISPMGGGTGATCTATACTATKAGTYTVIGTYAGFTAYTTLTVTPAVAQTITVAPDDVTTAAGTPVTYAVSAVDAYGNALPDQTGASTITVTPAAGGDPVACPQAACAPTKAGSYLVTATLPVGAGSLQDTTPLTVTPSALDSLDLSPQGASTIAGSPVHYTVSGTDAHGNAIEGQQATYGYRPVDDAGNASGDEVVCAKGDCAPTKAGTYLITATAPGVGDPVTATSTLTVAADGVATLSISPEDATTAAGTPVQYAVGGVDRFGNPLPDQTGASTITYTPAGGGDAVTCADASCAPTAAGVYSVSATEPGADAPLADATTLTVVPAGLDAVALTPVEATTAAGEPVQYAVSGTDAYGNALPDQTSAGTVTISPAEGGDPVTCKAGLCHPTTAGDYTVAADVARPDADPVGDQTTLHVVPGGLASLTLSPDVTRTTAGDPVTYSVSGADAFGNDLGDQTSASAVTITPVAGGDPVSCPDAVCTPATAGSYRVQALESGVGDTAALTVDPTTTTVTLSPVGPVTYGDDVPTAATVTPGEETSKTPAGTVQFVLDGDPVGDPAQVGPDGSVTGPVLTGLHAGLHTLTGTFASTPDGAFEVGSAQQSFVVAAAPTTTEVSVSDGSASATVDGGKAGLPTGSVRFELDGRPLGSASLADGVATYTGSTRADRDSVITATYSGDQDFTMSSGSTARTDPTITAGIGGTPHQGWYDAPVTVTFTCTPGSGSVTCPAPVTLDTEGADQSVVRSIAASDGGVASVTAGPVNIDLTAPTAAVGGVKSGAAYNGHAPVATCVGRDALSGVASCTVATRAGASGSRTTTATVTDVAGNTATSSVTYVVRDLWVTKSTFTQGAWVVPAGKDRTVHVLSKGRPSLKALDGGPGATFLFATTESGKGDWVALLHVPAGTRSGKTLHYTVTTSDGSRPLKVRVR